MPAQDSARDTLSALATGAVFLPQTRACVRVRGKDARAFVHRMSTQATQTLTAGEARLNVLTNKQGRVIDVVHHLALGDEEVTLLGCRDETGPLLAWLDSFLFVEKLTLEDASGEGAVLLVAGAKARAAMERLLPGAGGLGRWAMARAGERLAVRTFDLADGAGEAAPAFLLWDRAADVEALAAEAERQGAQRASPAGLEAARVAAGVPAFPGEVSDRINPLELELHDAIHWSKGCYIGQEVIARIDNYGKQARMLVGVLVDGGQVRSLRRGDRVKLDGKDAGELTSVAPEAVGGMPAALALVRHKGEVEGGEAVVVTAAGDVEARLAHRRAAQAPHD